MNDFHAIEHDQNEIELSPCLEEKSRGMAWLRCLDCCNFESSKNFPQETSRLSIYQHHIHLLSNNPYSVSIAYRASSQSFCSTFGRPQWSATPSDRLLGWQLRQEAESPSWVLPHLNAHQSRCTTNQTQSESFFELYQRDLPERIATELCCVHDVCWRKIFELITMFTIDPICTHPQCRPSLCRRGKSISNRSLVHLRTANSRCSGGIWSCWDWSCSFRRVRMSSTCFQSIAILIQNSDGIARVHGMRNVQAEELVECVLRRSNGWYWNDCSHITGSHLESRECAWTWKPAKLVSCSLVPIVWSRKVKLSSVLEKL